jgi:hypothetical protein
MSREDSFLPALLFRVCDVAVFSLNYLQGST